MSLQCLSKEKNKKKDLKKEKRENEVWSISSCSSVGSNDRCSLSNSLSLYLTKDKVGIVTNSTTAVGKIVFIFLFKDFHLSNTIQFQSKAYGKEDLVQGRPFATILLICMMVCMPPIV
jgi:hypothetical protein